MRPKIFKIVRADEVVAYGCIFDNGKCIVSSKENSSIIAIWDTIDDMYKVYQDEITKILFY